MSSNYWVRIKKLHNISTQSICATCLVVGLIMLFSQEPAFSQACPMAAVISSLPSHDHHLPRPLYHCPVEANMNHLDPFIIPFIVAKVVVLLVRSA